MKKIVLSNNAKLTLDEYFYDYCGTGSITDMPQRAYHYRRIMFSLFFRTPLPLILI